MRTSTIYLIRKKALGDVLWIEPVIRQLCKKHKRIIVYTKNKDLFYNYPHKHVVFKSKLNIFAKLLIKIEKLLAISFFTINLDKSYESNPQQHFLHAYQQKAGVSITREYPCLYLSEEESKRTIEHPYIVLHLGLLTDKNYRKVHGVDWGKVVEILNQKGVEVVGLGKYPEMIRGVRYINTSLREMIGLIKNAVFFIGIDSGPSHIAASLNIPSVLFFGGSVNPKFRHFLEQFNGVILQTQCEHAGCYHNTVHTGREHNCLLVGDEEFKKCSIYDTQTVLNAIDKIEKTL